MGWVYLVKITTRQGTWYIHRKGYRSPGNLAFKWRWNTDRDAARHFKTKLEAESVALLIVARDPEVMGQVSVVRYSALSIGGLHGRQGR